MFNVASPMIAVDIPQAFRYQHPYLLADEFLSLIPKKLGEAVVDDQQLA
jgi:hypothetical protein